MPSLLTSRFGWTSVWRKNNSQSLSSLCSLSSHHSPLFLLCLLSVCSPLPSCSLAFTRRSVAYSLWAPSKLFPNFSLFSEKCVCSTPTTRNVLGRFARRHDRGTAHSCIGQRREWGGFQHLQRTHVGMARCAKAGKQKGHKQKEQTALLLALNIVVLVCCQHSMASFCSLASPPKFCQLKNVLVVFFALACFVPTELQCFECLSLFALQSR